MIIHYNQPSNPLSDDTEGHIEFSLKKLGHTVVKSGDADIYLFHKTYNPPVGFTGLKVCWYFDKLWKDRPSWMKGILNKVDLVFLTDETWARANPHSKLRILRQGIGDRDTRMGKFDESLAVKIAFTGSVYGGRQEWHDLLIKRYQRDFRAFNGVFNRQLFDLCESAQIMVAPPYPTDDHYWSNRIYLTLGARGFLLHPKAIGLDEEYIDGEDYVGYNSYEDLVEKIDYYLGQPETRNEIRHRGYVKTLSRFTYTHRCRKLLKEIQVLLNTGIVEHY